MLEAYSHTNTRFAYVLVWVTTYIRTCTFSVICLQASVRREVYSVGTHSEISCLSQSLHMVRDGLLIVVILQRHNGKGNINAGQGSPSHPPSNHNYNITTIASMSSFLSYSSMPLRTAVGSRHKCAIATTNSFPYDRPTYLILYSWSTIVPLAPPAFCPRAKRNTCGRKYFLHLSPWALSPSGGYFQDN